jgi:hypothetical protein
VGNVTLLSILRPRVRRLGELTQGLNMQAWFVYVLLSSDLTIFAIKNLVSGYSHGRLKMQVPEIYLEILHYKMLRQPRLSADLD